MTQVTRYNLDAPAQTLVTTYDYDVFGDLKTTTLPEGNLVVYHYEGESESGGVTAWNDPTGRLDGVERWNAAKTQGERVHYVLDEAGNRTQESHQRWDAMLGDWAVPDAMTGYLYTTRCHLDQVIYPDGSITEYDYDCNGNLEGTWDAKHPSAGNAPPTTTYGYDPLNRLETVTRPWDGEGGGDSITRYGYDVQDHLTSVIDAEQSTTDPLQASTRYEYSDRDLLTREESLVSGETTHLYNPHGELVETTDARGITEARTVDELDRVTGVDYPDDIHWTRPTPLATSWRRRRGRRTRSAASPRSPATARASPTPTTASAARPRTARSPTATTPTATAPRSAILTA